MCAKTPLRCHSIGGAHGVLNTSGMKYRTLPKAVVSSILGAAVFVLLRMPGTPEINPSAAPATEHAMFRGNPAHTGVYQSTALADTPHVQWVFHTNGAAVASPAVTATMVYAGSNDGSLYAIDRKSGNLRWKFATKSRVDSSPAVSNGFVYFNSYDGHFYAIDARTGRRRWTFQTAGERRFEGTHLHGFLPSAETMPDVFDVYLSSPVVWNGMVIFGSGDGNVYALDAMTGAQLWKFKTGDVVHASPAIAQGTVFIGSWDSYFYALNANDGTLKWRFKTGEDADIHNQVGIQSSAAVLDGIVYFGCRDSHLYALDERSGALRWSFPTHGSWIVGSPAVDQNRIYFATSDSGLLYELDARHGSVDFRLDFKQWPMFSSPAVAGDMLYIGSWSGRLFAIDLASRKLAWTFATPGKDQVRAALTKADGTPNYEAAYHSSFYDDMLLGYAKMMSAGAILASPVVVDGEIYIGSLDGNIYALN